MWRWGHVERHPIPVALVGKLAAELAPAQVGNLASQSAGHHILDPQALDGQCLAALTSVPHQLGGHLVDEVGPAVGHLAVGRCQLPLGRLLAVRLGLGQ